MTLAAKTLGAVKSNYAGTLIRVLAQFGAQVVIMRELGPELVGTFGYALLVFGALALVIDQGFGWALMQGDFSEEELRVVLSRLMLGSVLGMLFVFGMSYPLAIWLDNPLAGTLFRYSAPSYLVIAVYGISQARLRAELRFREIQYATTGAYLIAYPVVGVGLALAGAGVWALLAAWYAQAILQFALSFYFSPHPLVFGNPFHSCKAGALGRQVAGINVLNWAVDNASGVFAGALGPQALGNFNAASMLSRTPAMQLAQTMQTVLFSTASALAGDVARIRQLYLSALAAIAILVVPSYAYALTHADFLMHLVFGEKWLQAGSLFAAMTIGMVALAMSTLSGAVLTATGGQGTVLRSQAYCLVLMLAGLYFAVRMELVYVGIVISIAYTVRLLLQMRTIAVSVRLAWSDVGNVLIGPFVLGLLWSVPMASWFAPGHPGLLAEVMELGGKLVLTMCVCKVCPRFFFCHALIYILQRFGPGRRLVNALGL